MSLDITATGDSPWTSPLDVTPAAWSASRGRSSGARRRPASRCSPPGPDRHPRPRAPDPGARPCRRTSPSPSRARRTQAGRSGRRPRGRHRLLTLSQKLLEDHRSCSSPAEARSGGALPDVAPYHVRNFSTCDSGLPGLAVPSRDPWVHGPGGRLGTGSRPRARCRRSSTAAATWRVRPRRALERRRPRASSSSSTVRRRTWTGPARLRAGPHRDGGRRGHRRHGGEERPSPREVKQGRADDDRTPRSLRSTTLSLDHRQGGGRPCDQVPPKKN